MEQSIEQWIPILGFYRISGILGLKGIQSCPLYISVITAKPDPPNIYDWDVPILMVDTNHGQGDELNPDEWDLTTQQLLHHINGVFHIAKIANRAGKLSKILLLSKNLSVHIGL